MEEIEVVVNINKRESNIICSKEKKIKLKKTYINEILRAYYFAENTTHIVKIKNSKDCVKNYLGTSFIYTQMVFNMIYDKFGEDDTVAKEKITNLIDWLIKKSSNIQDILIEITDEDLTDLNNIIIDSTIRQKKKDEFLKIMKKINNKEQISNEEISEIFIFINNVRNNFFHGTKKAQDALERGQNRRLGIYSKFLLRLSSKFIEIIEKDGMKLNKASLADDLKENLGLLIR